MSDEIIYKYKSQIDAMQLKLDELINENDTSETALNVIGFYVEAIKTHVESLALYQEAVYGM